VQWHAGNVSRWQREQTIASKLLDAFESGIDEEGRAFFTKNAREAPPFRAGRKGRGPAGATAEPFGGVEAPAFRPGRTSTGIFHVYSQHGHLYEAVKLRFVYPPTFPTRGQPPSVYLESHRGRWEKGSKSHIEPDWRLCLFVPGESGIDFTHPDSLNELFAVLHTYLVKQRVFQRRLVRQRLIGEPAHWPGEERSHGIAGIREAIYTMGKIGRNAPCPCGSGVKYKRCCLDKMT
jgi:SEC-C motif-containing protein